MNFKGTKLIVLDIDGTLMGSDFVISDKVKNSIKKVVDKGCLVTLATGRMYAAAVKTAQELGITLPLITYQGALVKEFFKSDKELLHQDIKHDLSMNIIEDLRDFDVQINIYLNDELISETDTEILREYADKRYIPFKVVDSFNNVVNINSTKILAIDKNIEKVDEIKKFLSKKYKGVLNVTKSTPYFCEIVNSSVSKGEAVLKLAKYLGIKPSEIMAIGDQDNDKDMLKVAKYPIAMGNATYAVKKMACYVTSDVYNDGVSEVLDRL